MWSVPEDIITSRNDQALLAHAMNQVVDPVAFYQKVQALYANPAPTSDMMHFIDGRVFTRNFRQLFNSSGIAIGFKWTFDETVGSERKTMELRAQLAKLLTAREIQILALVGKGCRSREIAVLLGISPKTVANHRTSILAKLDATTFTELTLWIAVAIDRIGIFTHKKNLQVG